MHLRFNNTYALIFHCREFKGNKAYYRLTFCGPNGCGIQPNSNASAVCQRQIQDFVGVHPPSSSNRVAAAAAFLTVLIALLIPLLL